MKERLIKSNCLEANLGSHLSFDEAAKRLGCSKRTVHNHVKRGYLTKSFQNGKVALRRDEVEQLAVSTGVDLPAMNKQSFFLLCTKVQRLEQLVSVLQRALDIRETPLRPTKDEALQLYAAVTHALACQYWTDEQISKWATIFDRFDEVTIDMLNEHLGLLKSFEPFFQLCLAQMRDVSSRVGFSTNLELQILHSKLEVGQKQLRNTVLSWGTLRQGVLPEGVLGKVESDKGVLFQRLAPTPRANKAKI